MCWCLKTGSPRQKGKKAFLKDWFTEFECCSEKIGTIASEKLTKAGCSTPYISQSPQNLALPLISSLRIGISLSGGHYTSDQEGFSRIVFKAFIWLSLLYVDTWHKCLKSHIWTKSLPIWLWCHRLSSKNPTLDAYQDCLYPNNSSSNCLNVFLSQKAIIQESIIKDSTHQSGKKPKGTNHKERKEEKNLDQVYFKDPLSTNICSLNCCDLMEFPLIPYKYHFI